MHRFILAGLALTALATPRAMAAEGFLNKPDSVFAITQVYGDGIKLTGVALKYPRVVASSELDGASFSVEGRTLESVDLSSAPDMSTGATAGRYVVLHLSPADKDASLKAATAGGPRMGKGGPGKAPTEAPNGIPPIPIVAHPFKAATAVVVLPDGRKVDTQRQINLIVDRFSQHVYNDAVSGRSLDYNLYVPDNVAELGDVPLVLFMEDASCVGPCVATPLMQGLGAVAWASPEEQAKRPCIVVAPQYPEVTVDDAGYTSPLVDATARLIEDLAKRLPVDSRRIYTTGQSMGGMMSIVLMLRYPDLFASAYLVACQWVIDQTAPLADYSYWQMVSANDFTAFPWQNKIMEGIEARGVKINRGLWNAQWDANMWQFVYDQIVAEPAQIYYTVFAPGTVFTPGEFEGGAAGHMATWRYAYGIEPIREWLFEHVKR